ncbi:3277_t:CDS:1, partial [Funneliformis geosporum]
MSSSSPNPPFETVRGWSVMNVRLFLESKKEEFSLNDAEIGEFEKNGINGNAFLMYTVKDLLQDGLRRGPAVNIVALIEELNNK